MAQSRLSEIIAVHEKDLIKEWVMRQNEFLAQRRDRISDSQQRANSQDFLRALTEALSLNAGLDVESDKWSSMRTLLADLARERASQGFSPTETSTFIFSFKQPLFARLTTEYANSPEAVAEEIWRATELLDRLGLYTFEIFQKSREEIITRQQQEMLELSTPVVELWKGILALPLIGTLDSARTQIVMQNLLEAIVSNGADLAIVDITGVPTVDTLVAQHLLKTVAAARLMGAECIISGIRPQIAQTIIHLGVDLSSVVTKATLADAFQLGLRRKNLGVSRS
jgi:rsbT co-antagonist protein RsbR